MLIEELCRRLSERGHYSAELDDGLLNIRNPLDESEYILEPFEQSVQIRQGVRFDCHELAGEDLNRILELCSMMNARFSGCKSYVDQWGTLITAADILGPDIAIDFVEILLNQVEFISQAMWGLAETVLAERRPATDREIDAALDVPPLQ